jgi:CRP-like cAMP-binding protein
MDASVAATSPSYRNDILRNLPADEITRLRPHLTRVRLVSGQILHEPGERMEHAYFVEQGFVSMVADVGEPDSSVEVGLVGRESLVGLQIILAPGARAYTQAIIQLPGTGYRISANALHDNLERTPVLRTLLRQALEVFMAQIAQTAACNGRHVLSERLARWLLMAHDRAEGDELALTQLLLSVMLAVRRSGVTTAIQALEEKSLLRHSRGRILITDRPGLEAAACSCYAKVRKFATGFDA